MLPGNSLDVPIEQMQNDSVVSTAEEHIETSENTVLTTVESIVNGEILHETKKSDPMEITTTTTTTDVALPVVESTDTSAGAERINVTMILELAPEKDTATSSDVIPTSLPIIEIDDGTPTTYTGNNTDNQHQEKHSLVMGAPVVQDIPVNELEMEANGNACRNNSIHEDDSGDSDDPSQENNSTLYYISRTLSELEDATKRWFLSEPHSGISTATPVKQKDSIELFSLQFNEASISTIAVWVAGGPQRRVVPNTTLYRPVIDTRFRRCSVCQLFGHYEVECKLITPDLTVEFSKYFTTGSNDNKCNELPPTSKQKQYDVTIELCDGYLIEQRSHEEENDGRFNETGQPDEFWARKKKTIQRPRMTVEIDGVVIREIEPISDSATMDLAESGSASIHKGCLVTWIVPNNDTNSDSPGVLAVGTVLDMDTTVDRVQVKVLRIIEKTNHLIAQQQPQLLLPVPTINSIVWLRSKSLYFVNGRNQLLRTNNIITKKRRQQKQKVIPAKKTQAKKVPKKKPLDKQQSRLCRPSNNVVGRSGGPSKQRLSPKPDGLIWDANESIWVLPPPDDML